MEFQGKTAIITGAAVGIGRAVALQLAKESANVVLVDIDPENLAITEQEIKALTENALALVCDITDHAAVLQTVEKVNERFGKVDILVNNAALWRTWGSFSEIPVEVWKKFFDVNVMGRIINVASVAGVYGNAKFTHYSATKGAVISFTKALAKEVTDKGITVNAVSPGSVSPSKNRDIDYHVPTELSFMGRTGTDRENAELICFLASDKAAYISGQNIQIDGCRKKQ